MEAVTRQATVAQLSFDQCLEVINQLDLASLADAMGLEMDEDALLLPYFDDVFRVSKRGIVGPDFREAAPAVKTVLARYLLMYPESEPSACEWSAFRDLPGAEPFAGDFRASVEMTLARMFTGKRMELLTSCAAVGGLTPADDMDYDASSVFQALPCIDLLLLFNEADETFPAKCLVLFGENAHRFLDMESLAMVAWRLAFLIFNMSGFELPEE